MLDPADRLLTCLEPPGNLGLADALELTNPGELAGIVSALSCRIEGFPELPRLSAFLSNPGLDIDASSPPTRQPHFLFGVPGLHLVISLSRRSANWSSRGGVFRLFFVNA